MNKNPNNSNVLTSRVLLPKSQDFKSEKYRPQPYNLRPRRMKSHEPIIVRKHQQVPSKVKKVISNATAKLNNNRTKYCDKPNNRNHN